MRKAIKPFTVEHKGSRKAPKPSALFDENDMFGTDEKPPRDVREEHHSGEDSGYEAALKAADAIFAKATPAPVDSPSSPSTATTEPTIRILTDLSYNDPLEARLAAIQETRRGRKPGSKNKPKPVPTAVLEQAPAPVMDAPSRLRVVATRRAPPREAIGYREQIARRHAIKPGARWKLKILVGRRALRSSKP